MTLRLPSTADLRHTIHRWRATGQTVALVPTMGALHDGHMELVRQAKQQASHVVVSIFVNPTQFGPNEDYAAYPRLEDQDIALCTAHGVDAVFLPSVTEVYPEGFATKLTVAGLPDHWCGASRPGHFDGVATIVAKLLLMALPDVACFGEKDYQQLAIIRRLTADLNLPVTIHPVPTYRESDGLAFSSRNRYLTPDERRIAPALYATLQALAADIKPHQPIAPLLAKASADLVKTGFLSVDYLGLADAESLLPQSEWLGAPARLLVAARLGKARLIDNVAVPAAIAR
jgi:pantoate--beta-alanine ligase